MTSLGKRGKGQRSVTRAGRVGRKRNRRFGRPFGVAGAHRCPTMTEVPYRDLGFKPGPIYSQIHEAMLPPPPNVKSSGKEIATKERDTP